MNLPKEWKDCPKKSYLIGKKFVAFKTPLDQKFKSKLKESESFTPDDVFEWMKRSKLELGLWIDLTKTTRYFDGEVVQKRGCQYEKIMCEGHGSVPDRQQVKAFTDVIDKFISEHPEKIIAVHCTHGYNRTGFLIVTYMVTRLNYQVDDALKDFFTNRPPGIYREQYVKELIKRHGGDIRKHFIVKPSWIKPAVNGEQIKAISGSVTRIPEQLSYVDPEERRRQANRKRWTKFDEKRREKRKHEKSEDRPRYSPIYRRNEHESRYEPKRTSYDDRREHSPHGRRHEHPSRREYSSYDRRHPSPERNYRSSTYYSKNSWRS